MKKSFMKTMATALSLATIGTSIATVSANATKSDVERFLEVMPDLSRSSTF